ncbi:MAG TPA: M48 family metalloprotease [Bryobacteraceae bacterium]
MVFRLMAQLDPEGAQVISYFPQLVDGGSITQRWNTTLTLVNPHQTLKAVAIAYFYDDSGKPLPLDFGHGLAATFTVTIPPQGSVTYKSLGTSPTTITGWAVVGSTLPLQGVIQFSYSVNGVAQQGVSTQATPASFLFRSPATISTGLAVANPNGAPISIAVNAIDSNGNILAKGGISLPESGHRSLTISQMFPSLNASFRGTVTISTPVPQTFVAWTLSGDGGVLSSYPPAGLRWPVSQTELIYKVWLKVLNTAATLVSMGNLPNLVIDYTTGQINSYAVPASNEVHIFMNLAELISDSESELAFVVGHELGHIIQYKTQQLAFVPDNAEEDADEYGVFLSMLSGYDPYGGAGALAKLAMVSGTAGLVSQVFDNLSTDPHGSFNNRLALVFTYMQAVCSAPQAQAACAEYKSIVHPHLPSLAPLVVKVAGPN